jgi:hypothetical protein
MFPSEGGSDVSQPMQDPKVFTGQVQVIVHNQVALVCNIGGASTRTGGGVSTLNSTMSAIRLEKQISSECCQLYSEMMKSRAVEDSFFKEGCFSRGGRLSFDEGDVEPNRSSRDSCSSLCSSSSQDGLTSAVAAEKNGTRRTRWSTGRGVSGVSTPNSKMLPRIARTAFAMPRIARTTSRKLSKSQLYSDWTK